MDKVIAERRLFYSEKGSDVRHEFKIRIGMPYPITSWNGAPVDGNFFGCRVEFEGLDEPSREAYGGDSLQAVQLASNIDPYLKILQKKYDLYYDNDDLWEPIV